MSGAQATESIDLAPALRIADEMSPLTSGDIIPLLQRMQEEYGYLPREAVLAVCEESSLPASRVFGVATFYSQFCLEPRGKHLVRCCRGTACHVRSSARILDRLEQELGIVDGETTDDLRFTLRNVRCIGCCSIAPAVRIDGETYGNVRPNQIGNLLRKYR